MKIHLPQLVRLLTATSLFVWAVTVSAQQVIAPPPEAPVVPGALQPSTPAIPSVIAQALGISEAGTPFHWGPVQFEPRVTYSFSYGTGIQASPGQPVNSVIQQVAPGFTLNAGSHWTLDYEPVWTFYSSPLLTNTFDQSVTLAWGTTYEDWVLGLSQNYATSSGPRVDTGGQTREEMYSTAASVSYNLTPALQLQVGFSQSLTYVDQGAIANIELLSNSKSWSTTDWLNYQFWQGMSGAVGAGFGYVQSTDSPDQTYEQYQARLSYQATGKMTVTVNGGLEDQQLPANVLTPTFGVSAVYTPFDGTAVTLSANRSVAPAIFQGESSVTTGFSADLTQKFLQQYYLSVTGGYGTTRYLDNATEASPRTDNIYSLNVRLSTTFLKNGTIAATYTWTENASNQKPFSYVSNQIGCSVGYRY